MLLKFYGATTGVTGSCSLINHTKSDTQFLVDCGIYIGNISCESQNNQPFPFDVSKIEFVLLTHAHLDHCGLIPKLYKDGFSGKVLCTKATADLARITLLDYAKNSVVYGKEHVDHIKFEFIDTKPNSGWAKQIHLANDLRVSFLRSSHILGASSICINWAFNDDELSEGKTILFSGDIGCNFDKKSYLPLLKDNQLPFVDTDYIVIESTYGGRKREERFKSDEKRLKALADLVRDNIFLNNGKLLIPAFSIHRTQEILFDLFRVFSSHISESELKHHLEARQGYNKEKFAIYCHSPMAEKANKVFCEELLKKNSKDKYFYKSDKITEQTIKDLYDEGYVSLHDDLAYLNVVKPPKTVKKSRNKRSAIKSRGEVASIIIASAGMCDAGPVSDYLNVFGQDENNAIAITGFQAANSKGRSILDGTDRDIKSKVYDLSGYYSAHADENDLLNFLFDIQSKKQKRSTSVFINHGTTESKKALSNAITDRNGLINQRTIDKIIQLNGEQEWFDLNTGEEILIKEFSIEAEIESLHNKIDKLNKLVNSLITRK